MTPSAIRFYQKRFAPHIRPARIATKSRRGTHHYVYSQRDVQVLRVILILRRQYGLSVREARERLHDLLVTHHGDPFAIERELVPPREEPSPQDLAWPASQGELPLEPRAAPPGPAGLDLVAGVREPTPGVRALERDPASALEERERELADARRALEEQSVRLRELERALQRLRVETEAHRMRVRQAVRELLMDVSDGKRADGSR